MTLIKQFKSGDTLWGVLSIFFAILVQIWCFMNGHKAPGMMFVYAIILYLIVLVLVAVGGGMVVPELAPQ